MDKLIAPFRDLLHLVFAAFCVAATVVGWMVRRR